MSAICRKSKSTRPTWMSTPSCHPNLEWTGIPIDAQRESFHLREDPKQRRRARSNWKAFRCLLLLYLVWSKRWLCPHFPALFHRFNWTC
jgi:hypothetical protein